MENRAMSASFVTAAVIAGAGLLFLVIGTTVMVLEIVKIVK
jgi:hypothetical protein